MNFPSPKKGDQSYEHPKRKPNSKRHIVRSIMRRRTLLASQNVLFIDEVNKMLYPFDDFPFKVKPPVMFEPSEKEVA